MKASRSSLRRPPVWKKNVYKFRLLATALVCIWTVVLAFAWFCYHQEKELRQNEVIGRIDIANGNIIDTHEAGGDVPAALNFVDKYLQDTYLSDMSVQVYDTRTRQMRSSIGEIYDGVPPESIDKDYLLWPDSSRLQRTLYTTVDHKPLFYYSSRISPDGALELRTYVPLTPALRKAINVNPAFWVLLAAVLILGTLMAYVSTSHQARNVQLLREFASRAADDIDFIPMGDYPSDEIGEISRQIVAIYNSRMQANMRREHEHEIALQAIEEKNKMKRVMTDNISHELKTPIGIIRAYVDMLLNQPDMTEADRNRFLQKTQVNVERIVAMLNDLSTMTRLEESGGKIPMKKVDFHTLVKGIVDDSEASGILKGMHIAYHIPADCVVMGNEGLLSSVLQNLIKNAVAYSQGTEIGINTLGCTPNYYTFSLYDNGVGVDKVHIPHLFDRFYRIDTGRSRKTGGTGLGLPIVKSSINNMGGSITVRNRAEGGLEFIFTLPRPKA